MSQLRQPGDYLKYNRTRTLPSCVCTFTAEANQKKEINQERQNSSDDRGEQFETADSQEPDSAEELDNDHEKEQT